MQQLGMTLWSLWGSFISNDVEPQNGLHFCLSAMGPLQLADSPQDISLKSMWLSRFSSKAWNKPGKDNDTDNINTKSRSIKRAVLTGQNNDFQVDMMI